MISKYKWCSNIHYLWITMMSKYPWCPNSHDVQISVMSEYPWCLNIHDVRISSISEYPWRSNILNVQIYIWVMRVNGLPLYLPILLALDNTLPSWPASFFSITSPYPISCTLLDWCKFAVNEPKGKAYWEMRRFQISIMSKYPWCT